MGYSIIEKFVFKLKTSKISFLYRKYNGVFKDFNTLKEDLIGHNNLIICAKAQSINEISNKKLKLLLDDSDYKLLANSVDIDNHKILSKTNFNTQCSTRVDNPKIISPVFHPKTLENHNIKSLCINSTLNYQNGISIERFRKFYKKYGLNLLYIDDSKSPVNEDPQKYGGRGLTIVQKILTQAIACPSIKKITIIGVDFFGTKYLDSNRKKSKEERARFYSFNAASNDPRKTHGLPLLRYLCELCDCHEFYKDKKIHLPKEVKKYIPNPYLNRLKISKGLEFV